MFESCLQKTKSVIFERLVVKFGDVWLWSLWRRRRRENFGDGEEKVKERV